MPKSCWGLFNNKVFSLSHSGEVQNPDFLRNGYQYISFVKYTLLRKYYSLQPSLVWK